MSLSGDPFLDELEVLIRRHRTAFGDFTGAVDLTLPAIRIEQSVRPGPVPHVPDEFIHDVDGLIRKYGRAAAMQGVGIHFNGGNFINFNPRRPPYVLDEPTPVNSGK
jgi:hypothetical protein